MILDQIKDKILRDLLPQFYSRISNAISLQQVDIATHELTNEIFSNVESAEVLQLV
jgi:hypothetical protein